MDCSIPGFFPVHHQLAEIALPHVQDSVMPSSYLILCHPLLFLPSIFSSIRIFPNESVIHIRWSKYWSFNFSISSSNEYSDFLLDRLVWYLCSYRDSQESSPTSQFKASILWCSTFIKLQLSYPYMTTGKTIALSTLTFVSKVMSLLLICLSIF